MPLISEEPAGGRLRGVFAPRWLAEVVRLRRERVPWAQMTHAVLAVCVPLGAGLAIHKPVLGVLPATGGLLSTLVNRSGPYRARIARIAATAVCGGAAGLTIGTLIHGRGWVTVAPLVGVAGVSAMVSVAGATASQIGLQLLVYTSFAIGPLGTLRPWWGTPLLFLAGVAWGLALLLPGWLVFGRVVKQRLVADVYRALAAKLRAIGTGGFSLRAKPQLRDVRDVPDPARGAADRPARPGRMAARRGAAHLPGNFAAAAEGVAVYLEQALAGGPEAAGDRTRLRRRMYRSLSDLSTQFQRTLAEPAAVSRRATAWWPAAVALERVMDQVTAASVAIGHGVPRPAPTAVESLAAALRDIASAVRSGREPRRNDGLAGLPDDEPLKPMAEAVLAVESALAGQRSPAAA